MGFEIKAVDITKVKADIVVNSLGVNPKIFGKICTSIVKAADNSTKDLLDEMCSWDKKIAPGDIKVTKGYKLKAKRIFHIVTPFYLYDHDLYALEYVYKKALVMALSDYGANSIALPVIGTGANGYPDVLVYKMIKSLLSSFAKYNDVMDIILCMPVSSQQNYEEKFDDNLIDSKIDELYKNDKNIKPRSFNYTKEDFKIGNIKKDAIDQGCFKSRRVYIETLSKRYIEEKVMIDKNGTAVYLDVHFYDLDNEVVEIGVRPAIVKVDKNIDSIHKYIMAYLDARYGDNKDLKKKAYKIIRDKITIKGGAANSLLKKHKDPARRPNVTLMVLMRYILSLHMNIREAEDFLYFCGKALNTYFPTDIAYRDLITKKLDDYTKADNYLRKIGLEDINPFI